MVHGIATKCPRCGLPQAILEGTVPAGVNAPAVSCRYGTILIAKYTVPSGVVALMLPVWWCLLQGPGLSACMGSDPSSALGCEWYAPVWWNPQQGRDGGTDPSSAWPCVNSVLPFAPNSTRRMLSNVATWRWPCVDANRRVWDTRLPRMRVASNASRWLPPIRVRPSASATSSRDPNVPKGGPLGWSRAAGQPWARCRTPRGDSVPFAPARPAPTSLSR